MMVNMPVEAINERCLSCPELDIEVSTLELCTDYTGDRVYSNYIRCSHLDRCRILLKRTEKDSRDKQAP